MTTITSSFSYYSGFDITGRFSRQHWLDGVSKSFQQNHEALSVSQNGTHHSYTVAAKNVDKCQI